MSHVHCHSHSIVGQVYKSVVSDTIAAVRSFFLDEGVDEQVLQELKQLWESKLNQSRAVDLDKPEVAPPSKAAQRNAAAVAAAQRSAQQQAAAVTQAAAQSTTGATAVTTVQPQSLVPIQITIPPQTPGGESKTIVVQVPVSAVQSGLAGQHLQTILSSAAAQATFALPPEIASNMLQQQLNDALRQSAARVVAAPTAGGGVQYAGSVAPAPPRLGQLDGCGDSPDGDSDTETTAGVAGTACGGAAAELFLVSGDTHQQTDAAQDSAESIGGAAAAAPDVIGGATGGAACSARCCLDPRRRDDRRLARRLGIRLPRQLDGPGDTSDSDDDDDVDDVDDDVDDDEDLLGEDDEEDQGQEEEPLNSEDDVSDHEPADLTETFNVMVCQYDKITRSRNKWKFHLKDGIMNLDGKDYIFQKAGGDAEW